MSCSWVIVFALAAFANGATLRASSQATSNANPVRKVVTMLQTMQKKVEAEGEKEKELYEKFMCYCKNSGGDLAKSVEDAKEKVPQVVSNIKESGELLVQTKEDLTAAQGDREAGKKAVEEATKIREAEAASYASEKAEAETNIKAIGKAVAALEKGQGGFLQTSEAQVVKAISQSKQVQEQLSGDDQETLSAFLQGSTDAPSDGVTGILKQMGDELSSGLADATKSEQEAIATYEGLMASKKKEVAALQKSVETKMEKVGELEVGLAEMKNDLTDTEEGMVEDIKFMAELKKSCGTADKDFEANQKIRGEELLALTDTIKILNDDDALEMFKKTLPGSASSFMQVQVTSKMMRTQALSMIKAVRSDKARLDFISMALHGKKVGFDKVIGMIDEMVATLKKEQVDDDNKKEYCSEQFDQADDKKKELERAVSDAKTVIAKGDEAIATAVEEGKALEAGIVKLDAAVAEATEQRKEENAAFKELMSSNGAAKDILGFAKNRLNKFYNPKLYKPELLQKDAPPPPPAAIGAYKKSSAESGGVIAMIDTLIKDLEKEMVVAETEEKDAQGDYEATMKDSAEKRAQDSKTLTDKESAKADMEEDIEKAKATLKSGKKELTGTLQYIQQLHGECDWLVQYYGVRKEARTDEIDSLGKAKDVLSGADFSLVQTKAHRHLRRA